MTHEEIKLVKSHLCKMELHKLESLQTAIIRLIDQKQAAKKQAEEQAAKQQLEQKEQSVSAKKPGIIPPTYNDIDQLADMQDLDLSHLMKEIARKR